MSAIVVLRPDDAVEAAKVHAASMNDPWSAASISQSLENSNVLGLGVEEEGALLGFGLISIIAGEAEVLTLAVDPRFHRKGVARRLLSRLISSCAERGVGRVMLEVAEDNHPAISLYNNENFKRDGVRRGYYTSGRSNPVDAILMSRTLSLIS